MKITNRQRESLQKLDKELSCGARDQLQALLVQLKDELAAQKQFQSCKTSKSVSQLVCYDHSFNGRDGKLKLTYHESSVNDANLKAAHVLKPFESGTAQRVFKVYRPHQRVYSWEMIALMKKDGYRPATALELLEYYVAQLLQEAIVHRRLILVAFGTVWEGSAVYLELKPPTTRRLTLGAFSGEWLELCEFLAVRMS